MRKILNKIKKEKQIHKNKEINNIIVRIVIKINYKK